MTGQSHVDGEQGLLVPLEYVIPDSLVSRYATNMVVQHSEHEFVLSFFEIQSPVLLGSPEEARSRLDEMGSVRARCVARIIVAPERMPGFIQALQANYDRHVEQRGRQGE